MKEAEIQKQILEYLEIKGYTAWRNFVGPIVHGGNKRKIFFTKNPMAGLPDILGILKNRPGILFGIEVKREKKEKDLRPGQITWLTKLMNAGCVVFVASSLDTVIKVLEKYDVKT